MKVIRLNWGEVGQAIKQFVERKGMKVKGMDLIAAGARVDFSRVAVEVEVEEGRRGGCASLTGEA